MRLKNTEQKRCEGETEVFGQLEEIYNERRHLVEIENFRKYNRVSKDI